MPYLQFGDFAPDQPSNNADVLARADNVLFYSGQYIPLPGRHSTEQFTAHLGGDYTLVLARSFQLDAVDSVIIVVVQNASSAKVLSIHRGSIRTLTGAALSASEQWNLVQFGNSALLASASNRLQVITFSDSITAYTQASVNRGAFVAVMRTRVLHGGNPDAPNKLYFSGVNILTFDPAGGDADTNPGGEQTLVDTGAITAITGGENGHIFTERGIFRLTEASADIIYQIDNISVEVGCGVRGWAFRAGNEQYFYSNTGFKRLVGDEIQDIGHGRIDRWAGELLFDDAQQQASVVHWEDYTMLFFTICNRLIIAYNYAEDKFTNIAPAGVCMQGWTTYESGGVTIQDPQFAGRNITHAEYAGVTIGDGRWGRGADEQIEIGLVGDQVTINRINYRNGRGDDYEPPGGLAVIETNEVYAYEWLEAQQDERDPRHRAAIPPSSRMFSNEGRLVGQLYVEGADEGRQLTAVAVASRDHEYEPSGVFGDPVIVDHHDTICTWMAEGRYMAWRINIDGEWKYLTGIDVAIEDAGIQLVGGL